MLKASQKAVHALFLNQYMLFLLVYRSTNSDHTSMYNCTLTKIDFNIDDIVGVSQLTDTRCNKKNIKFGNKFRKNAHLPLSLTPEINQRKYKHIHQIKVGKFHHIERNNFLQMLFYN